MTESCNCTKTAPSKYQISGNKSFKNSFHGNRCSLSALSLSRCTVRVQFFARQHTRDFECSRTYSEPDTNTEPAKTSEEFLTTRVPTGQKCISVLLKCVLAANQTVLDIPGRGSIVPTPNLLSTYHNTLKQTEQHFYCIRWLLNSIVNLLWYVTPVLRNVLCYWLALTLA